MNFNADIARIARESDLKFVDVHCGSVAKWRSASWAADAVDAAPAAINDRRYLIASITKPMVAMAFLQLVAEGKVALHDRISDLLPEFKAARWRKITCRHLLTHTSGLPDMLPNNKELRIANASLAEFASAATKAEFDFAPNEGCRYSSVGFLLLGELIREIADQPTSEFLAQKLFKPLGMNDTWLGLPTDNYESLAPSVLPFQLPIWQPDADDWGWNSRYWQLLGAPWGGVISTAEDLGRFARMMLNGGRSDSGAQVISEAVVASSMNNQTAALASGLPAAALARPWGFGWRLQWPTHHASFGDFVSEQTVGHWGATGTVLWIDPQQKSYAAILTTTPYEKSRSAIQRMSNVIATVEDGWSEL